MGSVGKPPLTATLTGKGYSAHWLTSQDAQLHEAGCAKVYSEKVSGAKNDRAELGKLLKRLEPGDVLMVTRLDRPSPIHARPAQYPRHDRQGRRRFQIPGRSVGRYHNGTWPPDADSAWWLGRVRARADPCSYRGGKEACASPWGAFWAPPQADLRINGRKRSSDLPRARRRRT
jgi:hypothetical protein